MRYSSEDWQRLARYISAIPSTRRFPAMKEKFEFHKDSFMIFLKLNCGGHTVLHPYLKTVRRNGGNEERVCSRFYTMTCNHRAEDSEGCHDEEMEYFSRKVWSIMMHHTQKHLMSPAAAAKKQ